MKYSITLLISFTISVFSIQAQTFKEFNGEDQLLIELEQQIVDKSVGDAKKVHKDLIEKFTEMWLELGSFSASQKRTFYLTSNQLLKNRLKMIPDVRDYIETVIILVESEVNQQRFDDWHKTVDFVIASRSARKDFGDYMEFSSRLFSENIIYANGSVEWSTNTQDFQFSMNDKNPILTFNNLDLTCSAKGTSTAILGTSGVLNPIHGEWIGKNGTVTWERAGLDPNKVFAIINDYDIKLKYSNYKVDSVVFYNTDYFDAPLKGRLSEKVQAVANADRSAFPSFQSYSQRLRIANIDKGVDYEGGFTQKGSRFLASGTDEDPAYLIFYLDDKPFLEVYSLSFSIKEDKITSTDAGVKFILHEDSITHPGLDFKYFRADRNVSLFKSEEGLQKAPYFDSYHAIDIYSELVTWNIDQPKIQFTTIPNSSDNRVFFESDYYFRENRFDQMQGLAMNHPLVLVKNCFTQMDSETIFDYEVAGCIRGDKTDAMVMLLNYTIMGLVKYDPRTGKAKSTPRMYHYVAAKSEMEDYDVIQIASDIGRTENASMDLIDEVFTLKISGIDNIILSDSHNVVLYPDGGTVTMKKNRDFDFSGVVQAGRLEFFGTNYQFLYNDFKLEMPNVDSVRLTVETDTKGDRPILKKVNTVIEEVNGTLEIDRPDNKSGLKSLKQYPIFSSKENSKVYYQRGTIQRKAYKRENFFFELDPFVFDSLDNFGNDRIQFEGNFVSADIFPEFRETLSLQEDYSLGFIRETPPDGFDIYGGRGKYFNILKMSHEGLRGDGKLKYLTSSTKSDDFLFLPEEMTAIASSFIIEEQMDGVEYPPTAGNLIKQLWKPYSNLYHNESTEAPFVMYDGSKMTGSLDLTPEDLTGVGLFEFEQAELESKKFRFKFSNFESDTADFRLKSNISTFEGFQFKTNNVQAKVDFVTGQGDFVSNDGTSMMEFPINLYVAFMDRFTWYMDEGAVEFSNGETSKSTAAGEMQFEGSRFVSVHPKQDSLEFYSPAARYNLEDNIINAKQVEFIQVADALIYPDSGDITVQKKAKMKTLTNCRIVANAITKYHEIDSATVDIFARRDYVGTGQYTYKDVTGNRQRVRFNTIGVDSSYQTYAKGNISDNRGFTLSPYFDFKGSVNLEASNKELTFGGYTRITHQCDASIPLSWCKFKAALDPEDIYIPIESALLMKTKVFLHLP